MVRLFIMKGYVYNFLITEYLQRNIIIYFFLHFYKSAPTNLREIRFFDEFNVSLEVLEEFFEKWKGRPALSILTSNSIYEGEDKRKLKIDRDHLESKDRPIDLEKY
ncbi:unnamed protein product [Rhizophagus irregularis]|nr:unnamed protein product [Rhizophagus irregularis]